MLIKSADDKSRRLKLLEELQHSPVLDQKQKGRLQKELKNLRTGIQGEKDAAYYIDAYYRDSQNWAVLHDLRFKVDGEVAQIDHLLVGRAFMIALETKNFNGNVSINEYGEFSVTYPNGDTYGIPSPLEQSKRHERILRKLLEQLGIQPRLGGEMEIHHVVMFHPSAVIQRPDRRKFNTSNIIKADSLPAWHDQFVDKEIGILGALVRVHKIRGAETVREWAEKIVRQHEPEDWLRLPDFMAPKHPSVSHGDNAAETDAPAHTTASGMRHPVCARCGDVISTAEARYCRGHEQRFGGKLYCYRHQAAFAAAVPASKSQGAAATIAQNTQAAAKRPVCATCGERLENQVVRYCRSHAQCFGGALYCREHQKAF